MNHDIRIHVIEFISESQFSEFSEFQFLGRKERKFFQDISIENAILFGVNVRCIK